MLFVLLWLLLTRLGGVGGGMPILGTNSAACHPVYGDEDAPTKRLLCGVVDGPPGDEGGDGQEERKHVCFSSFEVELLQEGEMYFKDSLPTRCKTNDLSDPTTHVLDRAEVRVNICLVDTHRHRIRVYLVGRFAGHGCLSGNSPSSDEQLGGEDGNNGLDDDMSGDDNVLDGRPQAGLLRDIRCSGVEESVRHL